MNKVAIIADPHIGLYKNSEEYFQINEDFFDWFLEDIISKKVHEIWILGDWHHYRDEINTLTLHKSSLFLKKLSDNFPVRIITGNHDCYFKENSEIHSLEPYKSWNNITIYDKLVTEEFQDKKISFCPWGVETKDIPKSDIICGHFEIKNFKWNKFKICDNGIDVKSILKGSLIFSGHFHLNDEKQYKKGKIIYVGSPYQQDFNDVNNKNGYYILDLKDLSYEFIENKVSPQYHYIRYSKFDKDIENVKIKDNFIKLIVDDDINDIQKLDKLSNSILDKNPKNLIIESNSYKKKIDNVEINDTIKSINFFDYLDEYLENFDYSEKLSSKIKDKIKIYYEKTKKN